MSFDDDVATVLQITNQTWGNEVTDKYGQELDNAAELCWETDFKF